MLSQSDPPSQAAAAAFLALPSASALRARDDRLQALRDLVGHVAHDFNNSLVPMVGYLTLLHEEITEGMPGVQYLTRLDSSVRKTEKFVQTLLHATHPEKYFCPRSVNLANLVRQTTAAWGQAGQNRPEISLEVDTASCSLWLDEAQWKSVIHGLLDNAAAALPRSGVLTIKLRKVVLSPEQAADLSLNDTEVYELSIQDNGEGMPPEVLKRAFDPFFSTHSEAPAAGLGLTMIYNIVRLHGGQIALDSTEEAGTTVRIWLPAKET